MEIVLLHMNGISEYVRTNSSTINGISVQKNLLGKTASERFNKDLNCYIFTPEDYLKALQEKPLF